MTAEYFQHSSPALVTHACCVIALIVATAAAASAAAPTASPAPAILVAAAGDIACDPKPHLGEKFESLLGGCQASKTAQLVATVHPQALFVLGDAQYESGELDAFKQVYDRTWGRYKAITHPTPGNHEYYRSAEADGYFAYFGASAGPRPGGYYSFNLGDWHIISLNANCNFVGGCGAGSPEETWLRSDLRQDHSACTLAFWHQPRFSSGTHGSDPQYGAFWDDLYAAHADVILGGHDHDYERFAPQTPSAHADRAHGITEFVVGTGGRSHSIFLKRQANSEARAAGTFGVLVLRFYAHSFDWHFIPIAGYAFSDRGSRECHSR